MPIARRPAGGAKVGTVSHPHVGIMESGIEIIDRRECTRVVRVKVFLCLGNGVVVRCFGMSDL